jgi:hypothetical protein
MNLNGNYNSGSLNNSTMFESTESDNIGINVPQSGGGSQGKETIFTHLFSIEGPYKADIINVLQFSFISLIPVVLLNKLIQYVIPEASTSAGNAEICMEIVGQLGILLIGLILINRFSTYFNTYSGEPYPKMSVIYFVLGLLTVLISIQSRLGEKINILFDRLVDAWSGEKSSKSKSRKSSSKHDTVPDVQVLGRIRPTPTDTTQLSNLPVINQSLNTQPIQPIGNGYEPPMQYTNPNYDNNRPNMPQEYPSMNDEPTAANSMLGGSFGSVW